MGTFDIILVIFLGIVLVGGMGSLFYYLNKDEEK